MKKPVRAASKLKPTKKRSSKTAGKGIPRPKRAKPFETKGELREKLEALEQQFADEKSTNRELKSELRKSRRELKAYEPNRTWEERLRKLEEKLADREREIGALKSSLREFEELSPSNSEDKQKIPRH